MSKSFDLYKGNNRKAFAVFSDLSIPKKKMINAANQEHFHTNVDSLKCVSGYIKDDELFLSSRYVEGTQIVWVVTKKDA